MSTPASGLQSLYSSFSGSTPHPEPIATPAPTESPQPSALTGDSGLSSLYNSLTQPASAPAPALGGESVQKTDNEPQPQEGLLHKTWDFLNKPLIEDLGAPAQIQGGSGILGGVERGGYQVLAGLTSPLSLILTIGTLGTGGFLESAGANVLKDTLMAGADGLGEAEATAKVEQFAKAAKAAEEAMKTGAQPVSRAVQATGMDYNEFRALSQTLSHTGAEAGDLLKPTGDLLKQSLMDTKGLDEETAAREANQIQQRAQQATNTLKQHFLSEGLPENAADAKIAQFQKAAQAEKDAIAAQSEPVSAAVKAASGMDYDEFTNLGNVLKDAGLTQNDVIGNNITRQTISRLFRGIGTTPAQAQQIAKGTEFLLNAGFTGQQLSSALKTIPQAEDALKDGDYKAAGEYITEGVINGGLGLIGASHAFHSAGETWKPLNPDEIDRQRPSDENYKLNSIFNKRQGRFQEVDQYTKNWVNELRTQLKDVPKEDRRGALDRILMGVATGNDPELARQFGNVLADVTGQGDKKVAGEEVESPHPSLPEDLEEKIQTARERLTPEIKEHLTRWMNAYHAVASGLSDKETGIVKKLRELDDKTYNIGNAMGLIGEKIDNHMHQIWEKPDEVGNELMQTARTGKFETAVNTARHRVFRSYLDGLLAGYKIKGDDPIAVVAHDHNSVYKAAANRAFLDTIRDQNVRASDGRPLVVISGLGHGVTGPDGENSAYLVNQNRVRNIRIADDAVARMRGNGALDRFLRTGDILDATPKIRRDNVGSFIDKYEKMAEERPPQFNAEGDNQLRQDLEILKGVQNGSLPKEALNEVNAHQKPLYVWHPQDYVTPGHPSLQGWNWLTQTGDGTNILVRGDLKFHPESAQYMINRLGLDYSPLRDESQFIGKIGSKVLKGGSEAKAVLLSASPFHLMQIALRGVMTGVNPFKHDLFVDLDNNPILRRGVKTGLTIATDKRSLQDYSEGLAQHSKILGKIPVLGKAMDWYQDFLFNRYIPAMKADAFQTMFEKYKQAHPDWSDDGAARAAAEHVNNAYGGINWKMLGRSTATQDWFHILALAPDWLESEMRFAGSMFRGGLGEKNFSREQVLKMAAGLWGVARVLNYVNTGNFHFEAPFGLATKDKDGREVIYSVRTMPTDILHMASDPVGFIKGRMSPFLRLTQEAYSGRDVYGKKLALGDLAVDIAKNMAPIPLQEIKAFSTGDFSNVGEPQQIARAAGVTSEVYRTQAEKLASQLASQSDESGPIDPAKMQRYEALSRIEDGLRSGTVTNQDLNDAHDFGGLSPDEYKKIRENLKLTHGLDPETARLVTHVNRMTAQDALQVWDAATPRERQALTQVMIKKKNSYMKKVMQSETPQQRLNDPTFRRLRLMFSQPVEENQQ